MSDAMSAAKLGRGAWNGLKTLRRKGLLDFRQCQDRRDRPVQERDLVFRRRAGRREDRVPVDCLESFLHPLSSRVGTSGKLGGALKARNGKRPERALFE